LSFFFLLSITFAIAGISIFLTLLFVTFWKKTNFLNSLGVTKVIAVPVFQALPVLPILCT
jgi:hypothetical protein